MRVSFVLLISFLHAANALRGGILHRRHFLGALTTTLSGTTIAPKEGLAAASNEEAEKLRGLSNEAIADIVRNDVVKGQFLTNGVLTRPIYDESATFTDEIDTYGLDQWMRGTQKLFDGTQSKVDLVGDVKASSQEVEFRFSEILAFNIPFKPKVTLTGKVSLTRGKDGLITHYQEYWDQSVKEVLLSAKFN